MCVLQNEAARLGAELKAAKGELMDARQQLQDITAQMQVEQAASARRKEEVADHKALERRMQLEHSDALEQARKEHESEKLQLSKRIKDLESSLQAAQLTETDNSNARQSRQVPGGGGRPPPLNENGGGLAESAGDADEADPWEKKVAADVSLYGGSDSLFSHSPLGRPDASGQVTSLQQRCTTLEAERDKLADQLSILAAQSRKALQDEMMVISPLLSSFPLLPLSPRLLSLHPHLTNTASAVATCCLLLHTLICASTHALQVAVLRAELLETQRQLTLALELLGAREEELDDLRLTMQEQKEVFQAQVEALLVK